jgi:hypothetical protein
VGPADAVLNYVRQDVNGTLVCCVVTMMFCAGCQTSRRTAQPVTDEKCIVRCGVMLYSVPHLPLFPLPPVNREARWR